jgi:hypothetical protein
VNAVQVFGDAGAILGLVWLIAAQILEHASARYQRIGAAVLTAELINEVTLIRVGLSLRLEPVAEQLN